MRSISPSFWPWRMPWQPAQNAAYRPWPGNGVCIIISCSLRILVQSARQTPRTPHNPEDDRDWISTRSSSPSSRKMTGADTPGKIETYGSVPANRCQNQVKSHSPKSSDDIQIPRGISGSRLNPPKLDTYPVHPHQVQNVRPMPRRQVTVSRP